MKLRFELGCEDKEARTVQVAGDWVQITYDTIRDRDDNEIAIYNGDYWVLEDGTMWSDVIVSGK